MAAACYRIILTQKKTGNRDERTLVIREGAKGSVLYIQASGTCCVYSERRPESVTERQLERGALFGELALLYKCVRTASVRLVSEETTLWALDRKTFQQKIFQYNMNKRARLVDFLKQVPLFRGLGGVTQGTGGEIMLEKLADACQVKRYKSGTYIVRFGARGDTFFIISSGKVQVTDKGEQLVREMGGKSGHVRLLSTRSNLPIEMLFAVGQFFGEKALLVDSLAKDEKQDEEAKEGLRTANVIAGARPTTSHPPTPRAKVTLTSPTSQVDEDDDETTTECIVLDRESFKQLLGQTVIERLVKRQALLESRQIGDGTLTIDDLDEDGEIMGEEALDVGQDVGGEAAEVAQRNRNKSFRQKYVPQWWLTVTLKSLISPLFLF